MSRARADDLQAAATRTLEELGAEVRIFAAADNCVRRREPGEPCAGRGQDAARLPFVLEVEGLPNLLHEIAHVLLLGRVEKDHGTPYGEIPFDLTSAAGRARLFEEIACCLASCSWHPGDDAAADAWFAEQLGIQGLFFGFDHDPQGFLAAVEREVAGHRREFDDVVERAHARIAAVLGAPGRRWVWERTGRRSAGG